MFASCIKGSTGNEIEDVPLPLPPFPDEVLHKVFSYLTVCSLAKCAVVSKWWNLCAMNDVLWKELYFAKFGCDLKPCEKTPGWYAQHRRLWRLEHSACLERKLDCVLVVVTLTTTSGFGDSCRCIVGLADGRLLIWCPENNDPAILILEATRALLAAYAPRLLLSFY